MKRVRIVSEGNASNTRAYDADTGEEIQYVQSASWTCNVDDVARVSLTLVQPAVDIVGEWELVSLLREAAHWMDDDEGAMDLVNRINAAVAGTKGATEE